MLAPRKYGSLPSRPTRLDGIAKNARSISTQNGKSMTKLSVATTRR